MTAQPIRSPRRNTPHVGAAGPITILIVDDSEVVLELTKDALESAGYHVITHGGPSGSVGAILHHKPDVVLLDVSMPVTAGDTIAKILVRLLDSTLILLHSSLPLGRLQEKAREAGAHGYVQKMGNSRELVRSIEYWLNQTPWRIDRATPRKPRSFRMV